MGHKPVSLSASCVCGTTSLIANASLLFALQAAERHNTDVRAPFVMTCLEPDALASARILSPDSNTYQKFSASLRREDSTSIISQKTMLADRKGRRNGCDVKKKQDKETEHVVTDDPRRGKRVVCLSLLPSSVCLGTIQQIVRSFHRQDYWTVLADDGMMHEGPASSFVLYNGPTLQAGDHVRYRLDEGGYWEATVQGPTWAISEFRFLITITNGQDYGTVEARQGRTFAARPERLTKT